MPRCCVSVFERLQSFLPQMAAANEKLKQQMDDAPAGHFDIEDVGEAERVIEMVSHRYGGRGTDQKRPDINVVCRCIMCGTDVTLLSFRTWR